MTKRRVPAEAIPVQDRKPADDVKVIAYVDDASVSIYSVPCVAWVSSDVWWTGIPQSYVNLRDERWTVTHWLPLPGSAA